MVLDTKLNSRARTGEEKVERNNRIGSVPRSGLSHFLLSCHRDRSSVIASLVICLCRKTVWLARGCLVAYTFLWMRRKLK